MARRCNFRQQVGSLCSLLCVLVVLFAPVRAHAQVAGATLTGTITDPSGAVIPNAQVSIRDTATDVVRVVQADNDGLYTAPNLVPATYEVTVSVPGFVTQKLPDITLTVGAEQVLCFNLRGNTGRNTLIGPGLENLDFSIVKNNHIKRISESFNIQGGILQHPEPCQLYVPDLGSGNDNIFDGSGTVSPTAGLLTHVTTDPREIQFALKVVW